VVDELKIPTDFGPSDALVGFGNALALHALLLMLKVPDKAGAR
jgi:hypothetical protein